jgi:hypothetical protein
LTDHRFCQQMDIESRIRSRIEAILQNEAKHSADLQKMASDDEPPVIDPLSHERDVYERIIATCRRAVSEVNTLVEENVEFLSAFYRIVETIKEKVDAEEICLDICRCALEDFRAEYCGIVFFDANGHEPFRLEGVCEGKEFLRVHGEQSLLGSRRFYNSIWNFAGEKAEFLDIPDVYREPRFDGIDWPSVVRSLACVTLNQSRGPLGAVVLGHSSPAYFRENHIRLLRILSGMISHLYLLTSAVSGTVVVRPLRLSQPEEPDCLSVALLSFEYEESWRKGAPPEVSTLREIRAALASVLHRRESIMVHRDRELLVLLPGTTPELLPACVTSLRHAYRAWKTYHKAPDIAPAMNVGFATCGSGEDLCHLLEMAAAVMHPDSEPAEELEPKS